ncbi:MAG: VanW family protein [Faecousia sp.]
MLIAALAAGAVLLSNAILGGRIVEQVSVCGTSLGGLTRGEAEALLRDTWQDIVLSLPGETLRLTPEESGLKLDTRGLLKQAYAAGRSEEGPTELSLASYLTLEEASVRAALEAAAERLAAGSAPAAWTLEGELPDLSEDAFQPGASLPTLAVTAAIPSYTLDVEAAWQRIWESCTAGIFEIDLSGAAEAADAEAPDVEAIFKDVAIEAVDARMDLTAGQPIPGSYGLTFDRKELEKQLKNAGPGERVQVELEAVAPQVAGREVYFQDVLGFCQTPHGENEQRNNNLRLACEALNGVVIEPGQTLSYNATLGQRTEEAGYMAAPAYSGTRLINTLGGGICQVSSTLYLCSLYAGMETVERVSHGYPVSYMPVGLDATVSWGTPDLKIKNNSDYPIKIVAEASDEFVRVWLMGTETRDYYIRMGFSGSSDRYAKSILCKYDRQTQELISREDYAFSAYLTEDVSAKGEIGSEEVYINGTVRQMSSCSPSPETLEASRNYQQPNTRGSS